MAVASNRESCSSRARIRSSAWSRRYSAAARTVKISKMVSRYGSIGIGLVSMAARWPMILPSLSKNGMPM